MAIPDALLGSMTKRNTRILESRSIAPAGNPWLWDSFYVDRSYYTMKHRLSRTHAAPGCRAAARQEARPPQTPAEPAG